MIPSISFPHKVKSTKLLPAEPKQTWMGMHVKWLKEERHGLNKVGFKVLIALEELALALSIIGCIPLYKGIKESQLQDAQAKFLLEAAKANPPSNDPIELKSSSKTFNHVHEFAINDGILWTRPHQSQMSWKAVYFDGYMEGLKPKSLSCDGANLVVLDEKNQVHYKKILREFRAVEIQKSNRFQSIKNKINPASDAYIAIDKSDRANWKDRWFSLPYIQAIVNLFTGKRLALPEDAKGWAISHRGRYNDYLEDQENQHHPVDAGVTTLYVLDRNGKDIFKYDPWSSKHVKISIPLPESANRSFEAENLSVSASTIMAIGYETEKDHSEQSTLKIYTRLADIDSEGWNPGLKYDYFKHPDDPDTRVIPLASWQTHPLQLEPGDFITKEINILQTGEGNDARELRVAGQYKAEKGFFFKKINEKDWQFEALKNSKIDQSQALKLTKPAGSFQTTVHNYQSQKAKIGGIPEREVSARLLDFGQRSFHSKLMLKIGERDVELDLYKKKTLKNFIGFEGDSYELVVPEKLHHDSQLSKALEGKKVIPIRLSQSKDGVLALKSQPSTLFQFEFVKE